MDADGGMDADADAVAGTGGAFAVLPEAGGGGGGGEEVDGVVGGRMAGGMAGDGA